MTKTPADYALRMQLNLPYDQAVERVTAALKAQGFGVLTEIDVKATLKKKLDVDFRKYVILGACNPPLAYRAFQSEPEIGLFLPCNVIVYEAGEGSVVSIMDPISMLGVRDSPGLQPVGKEARTRLEQVIQALAG
jgi:uncharacterized protein (DUF302 family)